MSNSSEIRVSIIEESTPGVTPATPSFKILPTTGQSLQPLVRYIESQTISPNRNRADLIRVDRSSGGSLPCEMTFSVSGEALYQLIRAALCATEVAATTYTDCTLITGAAPSVILKTGIGTASKVGDVLKVTVATAPFDIGVCTVVDIPSADTVQVNRGFVGQVGGATVSTGTIMTNGTTHRSFTVEIARLDIGKAMILRHQVVNSLALNVATGEISKAEFTLTGGDVEFVNAPVSGVVGNVNQVFLTGATYTAPTARPVMDAIEVPVLQFGGLTSYECNAFRFTLDNNAQARTRIGLDNVDSIRRGQFLVTGSMSWYYDGTTEQAKYTNNQVSQAALAQQDALGNVWAWEMPQFKYSSVRADTSGPNTDDFFSGDFSAVVDVTNSYTLRCKHFPA